MTQNYLNYMYICKAGLALRQNKHVLRALMGEGTPQKSDHKAIYLIGQILG